MSSPEFRTAPDFTAEIEAAIAHATTANPLDPLNSNPNSAVAGPDVAVWPHDHIDATLRPKDPDTVFTTDSEAYYQALVQSARALAEQNNTGGAPNLDRIGRAYNHEKSHGRIIETYGNSQTLAHYAVRFVINPDGRYNMFPFVTRSGPLRKVHDAFSAAAPAFLNPPMRLSEPDKEIVIEWGYDLENLRDLHALALWTPPVPEGWTPA